MKPVIGLIPLVDETRDSLWMLPGYMNGVSAAGGLPLMLPLTDDPAALSQAMALCDGFLLTGGHDVDPALYGQRPLPVCGTLCPQRDRMERIVLDTAIAQDKPLLGICRGVQFINAALGGTLWQDLPTQRPSDTEHHQSPPYDAPVHSVSLIPGSPLHTLLRRDSIAVNSYHHQAVRDVAPGLSVMATAEDGLVEALCMPGKRFLWGVQWHPEFAYRTDDNAMAIFRAFVDACL